AAVPLLALGNPRLGVEHVTSWEAGYKGRWGSLFVELDGYYSIMNDFVTDVLPGVNPSYAPWTAPAEVAASDRDAVANAVRAALAAAGQSLVAAALTRLPDGSTAMVLSVGNAGRATVRGAELDVSYRPSPRWQFDANVAVFGFDLAASTFVPGDLVLPNTPARSASVSLLYRGPHGFDVTASLHATSAFQWAAGPFVGPVPSAETVNTSVSYALWPGFRLQATAADLFDQRRYQNFGGAVIGRRVLAGLEAKF
ncbi:MAG: TonB-dependent receptor, partial [Acetobacteraceae bacterium]